MAQLTPRQGDELQAAMQRVRVPNGPAIRHYDEIQFPGRGLCCIAFRDIEPGTAIVSEPALFSINSVHEPLSPANLVDLNRKIQRHPGMMGLTHPPNKQPTPETIFNSNNFEMNAATNRRGIFLKQSRFNHSCLPNAYFSWNPTLTHNLRNSPGLMTIYAMRKIAANEEILIDYQHRNAYRKRRERKAELLSDYGFDCDCGACIGTTPFGRGSNPRRTRLLELETSIKNLHSGQGKEREELLGAMVNLCQVLEKEQLIYPHKAVALGNLVDWYTREANQQANTAPGWPSTCRENALEFARKKLDLDVMCTGPGSPEVYATLQSMQRLLL